MTQVELLQVHQVLQSLEFGDAIALHAGGGGGGRGGVRQIHMYEERVVSVSVRTYLDAEHRQAVEPVQVLELSDLIRAEEQTVQ